MKKKMKLKDIVNEGIHSRALGGGIVYPSALGEDLGGEEELEISLLDQGGDDDEAVEVGNLIDRTKMAAEQAERFMRMGNSAKAREILSLLHKELMSNLA